MPEQLAHGTTDLDRPRSSVPLVARVWRACTPLPCPEVVTVPDHRGVPGSAERALLRASLGAALRRARGQARLTQVRLAALAGCDRRTVQRLEAGQMRPSTALLAALAWALACPPGWSPQPGRAAGLAAVLEAAAGASLVTASPQRVRWRRHRLRDAQRTARSTR